MVEFVDRIRLKRRIKDEATAIAAIDELLEQLEAAIKRSDRTNYGNLIFEQKRNEVQALREDIKSGRRAFPDARKLLIDKILESWGFINDASKYEATR